MTRSARTLLLMGAMIAGAGAGYGCNKNPSDARNDAVEAQREADKAAAEARNEAEKKTNESTNEANNENSKAIDDAREKAAKAQANANEKIRDANRQMAANQNDFQQWGQTKIDEINNMIDEAKVKAQTAQPKARADFTNQIHEVESKRDALKTDLASLGARADLSTDHAKDTINDRVDQLKDRIRRIERAL